MAANHFEAKLHALRRARDGVVVSFVVHPDDVTDAFSRLAVSPLGQRYMIAYSAIGDDEWPVIKASDVPSDDTAHHKSRRKLEDLPLSQQIAIRCQDILFQQYVSDEYGRTDVVEWVRNVCGVKSRSEIKPGTPAAKEWHTIHSDFQTWLTDRQYAGSIR